MEYVITEIMKDGQLHEAHCSFEDINALRKELRKLAILTKDTFIVDRVLVNGGEKNVGAMRLRYWTSEWHNNEYFDKWEYYVKKDGGLTVWD